MELLERDDALGVLCGALRQVDHGSTGRTVVVSGEPGIGKTSLVTAFLERLPVATRALIGRCDDDRSDLCYG